MTGSETATIAAGDAQAQQPEVPPALVTLDNLPLGPYVVRLTDVASRGYVEQVNFSLTLTDQQGQQAAPPMFSGIYSSGRPAAWIVGWIDGVYCSPVRLEDGMEIDLGQAGLDRFLFTHLGELVPPNGRLMVAYEAFHAESPVLSQTREALYRGVPPLATPIGELLFHADCWLGIRDWYIPEGGREGHRKLQGNKALDANHRQRRSKEALEQLRVFLNQTRGSDDELIQAARERSEMILGEPLPYAATPSP